MVKSETQPKKDALAEVIERFNHLDNFLSDEGACDRASKEPSEWSNMVLIAGDLWRAIKAEVAARSSQELDKRTPSYEELVAFARWAQEKQPNAVRIMRKHGLVIDDLKDPMQKLAFSFYCDLVEIEKKVKDLLDDAEEGKPE